MLVADFAVLRRSDVTIGDGEIDKGCGPVGDVVTVVPLGRSGVPAGRSGVPVSRRPRNPPSSSACDAKIMAQVPGDDGAVKLMATSPVVAAWAGVRMGVRQKEVAGSPQDGVAWTG